MSSGNDPIGTRMKENYEFRAKYVLPRRTYTIIRVDMRCGHTYTQGMQKPYDMFFVDGMNAVADALVREAAGSVMAFTQSDECSILLWDFKQIHTEPWFDGNIQKLASVSASIATRAWACHAITEGRISPGLPSFDARAFSIPDPIEVANYFIWRQKDATRNSISGLAHSILGPAKCHGLNTDNLQAAMLKEAGVNWSHEPEWFKNGTIMRRCEMPKIIPITGETISTLDWGTFPATIFTQSNELRSIIPLHPVWSDDERSSASDRTARPLGEISPSSSLANPRF